MTYSQIEHLLEHLESAELSLLSGQFESALEEIEQLIADLEVEESDIN